MSEKVVKITSVGGKTQNIAFLLQPETAFAISVMVGNTGVTNDSNGRKIIKAGTPIGGETSALTLRSTVLQQTNSVSTSANTQGILSGEVDVTNGAVSATMIIKGIIDTSKLPVEIETTAQSQLEEKGRFIFINGGAE